MPTGLPSPFSSQHSPSGEKLEDLKRIEVRPRHAGASKPPESTEGPEVILNFSCPSCLEMLAAAQTSVQASVQCPQCSAWVMPPKIVNLVGASTGNAKTMLPPPRKTGTQALRQ